MSAGAVTGQTILSLSVGPEDYVKLRTQNAGWFLQKGNRLFDRVQNAKYKMI